MQDPQGFCAKEESIAPGSGVSNPPLLLQLRYKMLHYCYIVFMLQTMGRKPREEEGLVSNRVEAIRTSVGMSRQELADEVGVHYQTIGYIERGEYSPSLVLALRIADALGTSIEELFWIEGGK